jgi:hypothetical protein
MNKEIEALIYQAGIRYGEDNVLTYTTAADLEKLVNMVVKDCASLCDINGGSHKHTHTPAKAKLAESVSEQCGMLIKRHFGIK